MAHGVVEYHLKALEDCGLVRGVPIGNKIRYYPATKARRSLPAGGSSAERVLATLRESPGITRGELAARLHLQRTTLDYNLKRLVAQGLVVEGAGRILRPLAGVPLGSDDRPTPPPSAGLTISPDRPIAAPPPPAFRKPPPPDPAAAISPKGISTRPEPTAKAEPERKS